MWPMATFLANVVGYRNSVDFLWIWTMDLFIVTFLLNNTLRNEITVNALHYLIKCWVIFIIMFIRETLNIFTFFLSFLNKIYFNSIWLLSTWYCQKVRNWEAMILFRTYILCRYLRNGHSVAKIWDGFNDFVQWWKDNPSELRN